MHIYIYIGKIHARITQVKFHRNNATEMPLKMPLTFLEQSQK